MFLMQSNIQEYELRKERFLSEGIRYDAVVVAKERRNSNHIVFLEIESEDKPLEYKSTQKDAQSVYIGDKAEIWLLDNKVFSSFSTTTPESHPRIAFAFGVLFAILAITSGIFTVRERRLHGVGEESDTDAGLWADDSGDLD